MLRAQESLGRRPGPGAAWNTGEHWIGLVTLAQGSSYRAPQSAMEPRGALQSLIGAAPFQQHRHSHDTRIAPARACVNMSCYRKHAICGEALGDQICSQIFTSRRRCWQSTGVRRDFCDNVGTERCVAWRAGIVPLSLVTGVLRCSARRSTEGGSLRKGEACRIEPSNRPPFSSRPPFDVAPMRCFSAASARPRAPGAPDRAVHRPRPCTHA